MQVIDNQPISFQPAFETDSDCNIVNKKDYCHLIQDGDKLFFQLKNTPCEDSVICTDFQYGSELVTNGGFTGSDTGWNLGVGWAYNSNNVRHTAGFGLTNQIYQTGLSLIIGTSYLITWTVSNSTAGTTTPAMGNAAIFGDAESGNGTFSQRLYFNAPDSWAGILPSNDFDGDVDDISILAIECGWSGAGWTFNDGSLCHSTGTSDLLNSTSLIIGTTYKVVYTIEGMTDGSVAVNVGISAGLDRTEDGTWTEYIQCIGTGNFSFTPTTDFDGCITEVECTPMNQDHVFHLTTLGGTFAADITEYATYDDDVVSINVDLAVLGIDEGCYKVCVADACLNTAGQFDSLIPAFDDAGWNLTHATVNGTTLTLGDGSIGVARFNDVALTSTLGSTTCYKLCVAIVSNSYAYYYLAADEVIVNLHIASPSSNTQFAFDMSGVNCEEFPVSITSPTGDYLELTQQNNSTPIQIAWATLRKCSSESWNYDWCSNCINYKSEHGCTKLFDAYCDEDSLGFNFTNFSLRTRLRVLFINPTSKNRNENYKFSDGSYFKNFAERDKIYDLLFDYTDEITYDAINTMLICDHLRIADTTTFSQEYIWLDDDLKPEWAKEGTQNLAQARIKIERKDGHLTNSNL